MTLKFSEQIDFVKPTKLKEKQFLLVEDHPFQIISRSGPIKNGKHGSAKYTYKITSISTGKKRSLCLNADESVPIPVLSKLDLKVYYIEDDTSMTLISDDDELLEGVPIPKDELGDVIRSKVISSDKDIIVTYRGYKSHYQIISCKEQ